ncbi:hypothetical protein M3B46_18580 [Sphingobacterium daejeonense]|uniref:hypothetical protein n=1 Tax=Sphingobacterium daejeonense TaxID=371142 RepID=UPI0021A8414B|nr:hypothetical protein [Sphingobacterium daejeonense]MCT1533014.1 hypothetical protein [Sphingobacterium daejeonense]
MNPNYSKFLSFDLALYEIHDDGYDPLKTIGTFWSKYPMQVICDYLIELQTDLKLRSPNAEQKIDDEQLYAFSTDLYRVLVAYLIAHYKEIDLSKILSSPVRAIVKEELETSKKVYDFFQNSPQIDKST